MSKNRYINTKFWIDNYVVERDPIEKLLYLYLLTNTLTNILGIYEISVRQIAFDTGIDKDMVIKILERFNKDNKIRYIDGYIAIKNFVKHQANNPKINKGIELLLKEVPIDLIEWIDIDFNKLSITKDSLYIRLDKTSKDSNYSNSNTNTNTNTNTNSNTNTNDALNKFNLHNQKYKQTPKQKYKQIPEDEYEDEYEDESEDESNNENVKVKESKVKESKVKETNIVRAKNYTELYKIAKDFLNYQKNQFGKAVNNSPDNIQKSIPILSELIRLDGFSIPEIIGTLNFASNDDFWAVNVQSVLQLRHKKRGEDQTKFQKLYSRAGKWLKSEIKKSQDKEKQDILQKAFGK